MQQADHDRHSDSEQSRRDQERFRSAIQALHDLAIEDRLDPNLQI
jgi:hypothetical protein